MRRIPWGLVSIGGRMPCVVLHAHLVQSSNSTGSARDQATFLVRRNPHMARCCGTGIRVLWAFARLACLRHPSLNHRASSSIRNIACRIAPRRTSLRRDLSSGRWGLGCGSRGCVALLLLRSRSGGVGRVGRHRRQFRRRRRRCLSSRFLLCRRSSMLGRLG